MRAHSVVRTPPTDVWARLAQPLESRDSSNDDLRRMSAGLEEPIGDAERIRRHLDATVPGGWELHVELLPVVETSRFVVKSRLTVLGIAREDFGEGFSLPAASDDGLARAARRFGIGSAEVATGLVESAIPALASRELRATLTSPSAPPAAADPEHLATAFQTTADERSAAPPQSRRQRTAKPHNESRRRITIAADEDFPSCPRCGDIMWDDRGAKKADDAPDFRCRRKGCAGTLWVDQAAAGATQAKGTTADSAASVDEEFPF